MKNNNVIFVLIIFYSDIFQTHFYKVVDSIVYLWMKNNLNTFIQMVDEEEKKKVSSKEKIECEIEKKVFNKEINLGEIMYPFYSKNNEHFFKDIKCPKLNLPMLSITKFKNGKLIYINSDGIGENLVLSEKLYNKLKNEIIN